MVKVLDLKNGETTPQAKGRARKDQGGKKNQNDQGRAPNRPTFRTDLGGALAASTSAWPVEQGGEVAGSEWQKNTDRVREEAEEESDHDGAMGASEEKWNKE